MRQWLETQYTGDEFVSELKKMFKTDDVVPVCGQTSSEGPDELKYFLIDGKQIELSTIRKNFNAETFFRPYVDRDKIDGNYRSKLKLVTISQEIPSDKMLEVGPPNRKSNDQ